MCVEYPMYPILLCLCVILSTLCTQVLFCLCVLCILCPHYISVYIFILYLVPSIFICVCSVYSVSTMLLCVYSGPDVPRGREPQDAMSLRYADTSLPELLGRPSLRFAEMSMRNTSKCTSVIQEVFLNLCFKFK